jgi:predicted AlkP superfamily pyrophosphatase or phosphodiesterase
MRAILLICFFFIFTVAIFPQAKTPVSSSLNTSRPKLVVGIVVDQMRWDYLYRFYDRYTANGGFKRFLQQGFSCENTLIPYTPTVTACGHTCVYTGSVPAIHGIVGNNWYDNLTGKGMYCTQDDSVHSVGTTSAAGAMSPKNMLVTTVCDELKLATNFRSKVIGLAIKDRGGILPAGHAANAAYWYEPGTGNWISSSYYMNDLPQWVKDFNARKIVDSFYKQGWNTLFPVTTYVQSTSDEKKYEVKPFGAEQKAFPYTLSTFIGKNYGAIASTPYGNSMTTAMAQAAITNEQLGADAITDFLTVSYSSTDYIGHAFGPNSIEQEDDFLRLDKTLGDLFTFLDARVGKGQYLVFLSADHAVAHVPGFNEENKLPGRVINNDNWRKDLDKLLTDKFSAGKLITTEANNQFYLDHALIDSLKLDVPAIKKTIIDYISKQKGVSRVFALDELATTTLNSTIKNMVSNGYFPPRCGDIQVIFLPGWIDGGPTGTTHGAWYPYDAHIPLLFYGWNIKPGKSNREVYMTDIAPTIAALLHIQMPSGAVGKVIPEVSGQ